MSRAPPTVVPSPEGVEAYIARCPPEVQAKLRRIRKAIRQVAPDAIETMSYFEMPGYCIPGYDYNGMFAWFSFRKGRIGLHVRPPALDDHSDALEGFSHTKAILRIPPDRELPISLIKKLVRASLRIMKAGA